MDKEYYHKLLEETVSQLEAMKISLFSSIVNIGMVGVYPEIHACMNEGDSYEFEPAHFMDTGDANLDILMKALEALAEAKESLKNLNAIEEQE